jgi:hypothetical protein
MPSSPEDELREATIGLANSYNYVCSFGNADDYVNEENITTNTFKFTHDGKMFRATVVKEGDGKEEEVLQHASP